MGKSKKEDDNQSSSVSWTCGVCGETLNARTNAELGGEVSAHLSTHQNKN